MSRTREIKLWVEPDDIEGLTNKYDSSSVLRLYVHKDSVSPNGQMVKLIQELPERKVTISESDFMDSVTKYCHQNPSVKSLNEMMKMFKDDLFKDA